jgi:hypothetical protein
MGRSPRGLKTTRDRDCQLSRSGARHFCQLRPVIFKNPKNIFRIPLATLKSPGARWAMTTHSNLCAFQKCLGIFIL